MRICIHIPTGKVLETQSGGEGEHIEDLDERDAYRNANLETLRQNAVTAGFASGDLEVKYIADEEAGKLLAAQVESERTYVDRRRGAYPPAADYLDGIVKGDTAQVQAYIDACKAVKARFPKPAKF